MATPLLADPHGQRVPRLVQHDLESFFWTTLFGLVNFTGPFQQVKDWSIVEEGSTSSAEEFITMGAPPVWMWPGVAEYKFHDVHMSRLSTATGSTTKASFSLTGEMKQSCQAWRRCSTSLCHRTCSICRVIDVAWLQTSHSIRICVMIS